MSLKWVVRVAIVACCLRWAWSRLPASERAYLWSILRQVPEMPGRYAV